MRGGAATAVLDRSVLTASPGSAGLYVVNFAGERSVYRASRRASPFAVLFAALSVAAMFAALTLLNSHRHGHHRRHAMRIFTLELQPPPPPSTPKPIKARPDKALPIVAPQPNVIPSIVPPLTVATAPIPAPQPVAMPGPPAPAPAAAPPAAGPVNGGDLSSKMISAPPPTYPEDSRRLHEQGVVKLSVLLGPDGRVQDVSVASSSGSYRLDRAALSAVRKWRWSPTMRDGSAVLVRGIVTIPFVLRG